MVIFSNGKTVIGKKNVKVCSYANNITSSIEFIFWLHVYISGSDYQPQNLETFILNNGKCKNHRYYKKKKKTKNTWKQILAKFNFNNYIY